MGDADQREQPLAVRRDGADDVTAYRHRRRGDALHEDAHDRRCCHVRGTQVYSVARMPFMVSISRCWAATIACRHFDGRADTDHP